ncbi:MAG: rhodanese-like domain-containing protein [Flavobacteriales bacterium]|nr:rhodanese-like domain-containing protein [Flavobacteriales bacterium]MBP9079211.1 rhodanese-like domain-containing protein [Flavobacteriales bacterium]
MKQITAVELQRMKEAGERFLIIDVREPYELEICAIGGTSLPMSQLIDRLDEIPKDIPVVVHCNSGSRSCAVVDSLTTRYGYTNVINLKGGIQAWQSEVDATLKCE